MARLLMALLFSVTTIQTIGIEYSHSRILQHRQEKQQPRRFQLSPVELIDVDADVLT